MLRDVMVIAEVEALKEMDAPPALQLSLEERRRAKLCDLLEMWEFGLVEQALGNLFAQPIIDDINFAVEQLMKLEDTALLRYRARVEERFKCT